MDLLLVAAVAIVLGNAAFLTALIVRHRAWARRTGTSPDTLALVLGAFACWSWGGLFLYAVVR